MAVSVFTPYGICPACKRAVRLIHDGTVARHMAESERTPSGREYCVGSRELAEE